jgi:site-specific DNA-methyltransferase (adenine-specific)
MVLWEFDKLLDTFDQKPYYRNGNFVLYLGDSLKLLQRLPEDSIDMIFADPPYNLSNGGFTVHAGRRVSVNKGEWDKSRGFDEDLKFHIKWTELCRKILKPQGTIWISGTYHSIYQCGYALQAGGYHILNDIAWFKPNASPNLSGRYFAASHETLLWAKKDKQARHTFNYKLMKEGNWTGDRFKSPGKQMRSIWGISDNFEGDTIWSITTPPPNEKVFGKHPTQKPLALMRRIILASSNKGDTVLDPFTGSSTSGLASVEYGRRFIGIDTEKNYLDLSIKRFEAIMKSSTSQLVWAK